MKKLIYLLFLLTVLSFNLVSSLEITNYNSSINANVNVIKDIPLTFKNDFNYTIYNISLEGISDILFTQINSLNSQEILNRSITILTQAPYITNKDLKFKFYYLTNQTVPSQSISSSFTLTSFNVSPITLVKTSSVTWLNKDTLYLNLKINNNNICSNLAPNATCSYTFNNIGTFVVNTDSGTTQTIIVNDNIQSLPTHNPSYDKIITLNINSSYTLSNMEINLLDPHFALDWNGTAEGAMTIKNIGNDIIYNVQLASSWLSFNSNNFNLNPGAQKYLIFTVRPEVFVTSDTNKNHSKIINISTSNAGMANKILDVFINYKDLSLVGGSGNYSQEWWLEYIKKLQDFCALHPDSVPTCRTEPRVVYSNESGFYNYTLNVSLTNQEFLNYLKSVLKMEGRVEDLGKVINDFKEKTVVSLDAQSSKSSNITDYQKTLADKISSVRNFIWFELILFLFIISLAAIFVVYKKIKNKQIVDIERGG